MSTTERQRQELLERLTPLVADLGFDVDDIVVTRIGRRIQVRVTVDSDDGIGVDDIARVSRTLDEALDEHDPFVMPFVLEVSSPGVDRPLTDAKHWRRNVGRLVRVDHAGAPVTGRIVSADAHHVVLAVDGASVALPTTELGGGRVQVEFNRPAIEQTGTVDPAPAKEG